MVLTLRHFCGTPAPSDSQSLVTGKLWRTLVEGSSQNEGAVLQKVMKDSKGQRSPSRLKESLRAFLECNTRLWAEPHIGWKRDRVDESEWLLMTE